MSDSFKPEFMVHDEPIDAQKAISLLRSSQEMHKHVDEKKKFLSFTGQKSIVETFTPGGEILLLAIEIAIKFAKKAGHAHFKASHSKKFDKAQWQYTGACAVLSSHQLMKALLLLIDIQKIRRRHNAQQGRYIVQFINFSPSRFVSEKYGTKNFRLHECFREVLHALVYVSSSLIKYHDGVSFIAKEMFHVDDDDFARYALLLREVKHIDEHDDQFFDKYHQLLENFQILKFFIDYREDDDDDVIDGKYDKIIQTFWKIHQKWTTAIKRRLNLSSE